MKCDWILITAGLGDLNICEAAHRVAQDAQKLGLFSEIIVLDDDNIKILCPSVAEKYDHILNASNKGFGYMSWKAEVVYRTLLKHEGTHGIVWVDAGCEISASILTRIRLSHFLKNAGSDGFLFFTLNTKEQDYTKKELFNEFPSLHDSDATPQAQTTFFALAGETGMKLATRWFQVVVKNEIFINEVVSIQQSTNFVQHRHDQSVFSLVLKEYGYKANLPRLRNGRGRMITKQLTFLWDPIIAARNRYGQSVAPSYIRKFGAMSLRLLGF